MRRAIVVVAALVCATTAQAQGSGSGVTIGAGGGATFATGTTGDGLNTGWNGMAFVGFNVPMIPVGLRVDGLYTHNGFKGCTGSCSGDAHTFGGNLNAMFGFPMEGTGFSPYITGGVGIANVSASVNNTTLLGSRQGSIAAAAGDNGSETKFAWNVGAGVNFQLMSLALFVEARYLSILTDGGSTNLIPITLGVSFRP
ncbi:MAG: porin family protein [Gemmatimonadota bacterium]|nr:porin family protein [Gemmatimonadota bacterium]